MSFITAAPAPAPTLSVQRGNTTLTSATMNVTITSVDMTKSVVSSHLELTITGANDDTIWHSAYLTSSTNLRIDRSTNGGSNSIVHWQVATLDT